MVPQIKPLTVMFICILFSLTRSRDTETKEESWSNEISESLCVFFGLFVILLFKIKLKMIFGCLSHASQSGYLIHSLIRVQSQPNWCFCWCCTMLYHISISHYKNLYKKKSSIYYALAVCSTHFVWLCFVFFSLLIFNYRKSKLFQVP